MDVANPRVRPLLGKMIADGMHQVGLAQADAAVDEKRVVGNARVLGDLDGSGAGELVGLAGDEAVEGEPAVEPRALEGRRRFTARCGGRRGTGRRRHVAHRGVEVACQDELQGKRAAARFGRHSLDFPGEALAHQFQHETVRRRQNEGLRFVGFFGRERANPGVELLCGEFLLQSAQARFPEVLHAFGWPL